MSPLSSDPLKTPLSPDAYQSLSHFLKAFPLFYHRLLHHHLQIASDDKVWYAFRSKCRLENITDESLALNIVPLADVCYNLQP